MCRDVDHGGRRCPASTSDGQRRRRAAQRTDRAETQVRAFIGATPFRPESGDLMQMSSRPTYYLSEEWAEYDESLHAAAERRGLQITRTDHVDGLWEGASEPAGAYIVRANSFDDVAGWAGEIAGRYNQDSVMAGYFDAHGNDRVYSFPVPLDQQHRVQHILDTLREAGVPGGRLYDGKLEIAEQAQYALPPNAINAIATRLGVHPRVARARVEFIDATEEYRRHTPIKEIQALRASYIDAHGFPRRRRMPHLTEQDDIAAARAYAAAPHEPDHPRIARSYRAFRQHISAQWDLLTRAGYTFEPWHGTGEQPYRDSAAMLTDLRDNKHLYYFRTEVSQSSEGALPPDHPMAKTVTVTSASGRTTTLVANDVFRAVHDAIAHSEGHQFGPYGEKRAWWTHRSCLPRDARLALWNETRAQNCWTNAGPHMIITDEDGSPRLLRNNEPGWIPLAQRPYAEQKTARVHPSLT